MFTSLDQSVFPAHWCADYSKTHGFRAGGISKSLSHSPRGFAARLSAAKTLFRERLQYRQLRRLPQLMYTAFIFEFRYLLTVVFNPFTPTSDLRWLKTVSSTKILMSCYSHSLSLSATIMVSKSCSTIGEHIVVLFIT